MKNSSRKKILIFTPYYLPGYNAGGPIRSLSNLVEALGDNYIFNIVTADREFRSDKLYQGINVNTWNKVGKANVFYCTPDKKNIRFFRRLINQTPHDVIYLNSFFEIYFTIFPLVLNRMNLISGSPVVLAPRGELSPGALRIKNFKKQLYIHMAKIAGLYNNIIWHASNDYEKSHIKNIWGDKVLVREANNISGFYKEEKQGIESKSKGFLKIVFLSRISYKKNLDGALRILKRVKGNVQFDIYGPVEDELYWEVCQKVIKELPENIKASYKGIVPFEDVGSILSNYHLFFLPSKAENYGHVIFEALSAGCPALISDQTPWKGLEEWDAGYVISLKDTEHFVSVIDELIACDSHAFLTLRKGAQNFIETIQNNTDHMKKYKELFD